jgi:hypothetical protein
LRHQLLKRRAPQALFACLLLLQTAPTAALAQANTPEPVLDWAPANRSFGGTATIKGHLKNGTPGQEVNLQQKRIGGDWIKASTKRVDDEGRVSFKRQDLKKSTVYRLRYEDAGTGTVTKSSTATVRISAKLTLKVNPEDIFQGRRVRLSGHLFPAAPDRAVLFQQRVHGEWRSIKRVAVKDGYFSGSFEARYKGDRRVRATFGGDSLNERQRSGQQMTIYERDPATWYGPGLYGNRTACGQTLTTSTLGVAHKSLPCGTKVSLLYRGRTITVSVIDRGPYSHADWDLTSRTAERLGFSGSEDIGTTR